MSDSPLYEDSTQFKLIMRSNNYEEEGYANNNDDDDIDNDNKDKFSRGQFLLDSC